MLSFGFDTIKRCPTTSIMPHVNKVIPAYIQTLAVSTPSV